MSGAILRSGVAAASTLRSRVAAAAEERPAGRDHGAARCGARTRTGAPCRKPAAAGKRRCRLHGGATGSGAQPGNVNARKHGFYTREAIAERRRFRALLRAMEAGL